MAITINESDAYYISGKIIEINHTRLTISVTSPFTDLIEFECRRIITIYSIPQYSNMVG